MMPRDWTPLLDARTPYGALGGIIERLVDAALAELRQQLRADDWHFSPAGIEVAIELTRPHIEAQTRATVLAGWQACQLDGALTH